MKKIVKNMATAALAITALAAPLAVRAADGGDIRFAHWIRSRLRQEPFLLIAIRKMVDATPFWRVAGA